MSDQAEQKPEALPAKPASEVKKVGTVPKSGSTETSGAAAEPGVTPAAKDGVSPRADLANQLKPVEPTAKGAEEKRAPTTGESSDSQAAEAPFVTPDGAQTDRPAAKAEDVILPTTGGSAPPFGDQITQGGSAGPPDQVRVTGEDLAADQAAAAQRVTRKFDARNYTHSQQELTAEKLESMSGPEISAVAHDRGYDDLGTGAKPSLIRRFLVAQNKHKEESPDSLHVAGSLEDKAAAQARSEGGVVQETGPISDREQALNAQGKSADSRLIDARAEEPKS